MLCFVVIAEEIAAGARGWANGTLSALDYLGAGFACLAFAAVNVLPLWLARALCDRRGAACSWSPSCGAICRKPNASRPRRRSRKPVENCETTQLLRELSGNILCALMIMMIAAAGFGFGTAPATFLSSEIPAKRDSLFAAAGEPGFHPRRLGGSGADDARRTPLRPAGAQAHGTSAWSPAAASPLRCSSAASPAGIWVRSGRWPFSVSSAATP